MTEEQKISAYVKELEKLMDGFSTEQKILILMMIANAKGCLGEDNPFQPHFLHPLQ